MVMNTTQIFYDRIMQRIDYVGDCWIWRSTFYQNRPRYSIKGLGSKYVTKLIYEFKRDKISRNKVIMHTCNDFRCVNPNHIILEDRSIYWRNIYKGKVSKEDYFFSKFNKLGDDECWLFNNNLAKGYGNFGYDGKKHAAHRFSFEYFRGNIPKGMLVCHRCDVRNCVNPRHLFLGTVKDNVIDMVVKGRSGTQKLKVGDISEIRKLLLVGETMKSIGKRFGVTRATIRDIKKRKTWNHVL